MQRCAVLLRGINVGRGNRLAMADLRAVLDGIGCTDVSTYLQSGNALVTADPTGLAERVAAALPLRVAVLVFTADELAAVVRACPWPDKAAAEPKKVHVAYLDRLPDPDRLAAVHWEGPDELAVGPRVLYLSYADLSVTSPMTKALDKQLGGVATTRNWRTATALAELTRPG
ncbi:MAG TPA: DUF1697 domain-containing protein [Mycobacteriales bacterium]|jgi:uncharacterized protein (DUF1697 family)|nr:DUF1697 domain-containing protein [Mycobacteriales bacterium]